LKEIEEPFEKNQIGSSAMAYKRNPMRSERIASLARYVIASSQNAAMTSSTQWFERTLDDSANRRIVLPEAFLATDAILTIAINVFDGMVVYEKMIQKHIAAELPFMATENIIMQAVKNGGDRQELHEKIRMHSMETTKVVKIEGKANDLIERIVNDKIFMLTQEEVDEVMDAKKYIGLAPEQVDSFLNEYIYPILEKNNSLIGIEVDLKV
ncbi:adenylosuccinate lyase, partial [bacterium AH-315-E09]|nr:adenylosuccinate lyase [bacterium AH-315-E09]